MKDVTIKTMMRGITALLVYAGGTVMAFAAEIGGRTGQQDTVSLTNPLGADNLQSILERAVPLMIAIAAPVVSIMVLYGGFLMLTSAGDEEKISKGRKTITWAAIGFLAILLASSIVPVIRSVFEK